MNFLNRLYVRMLTTYDDEKGAAMAEYALLLALIAMVVVLAIPPAATAISDIFTDIADQLGGGAPAP